MFYQLLNKLFLALEVLVVPLVLFSCHSKQGNQQQHSLLLGNRRFPIEIKNRELSGNPYPKYFFNSADSSEYIYNMNPSFHPYIIKHKIATDTTLIKIDSTKIPPVCFDGIKGKLEQFYVVGIDSFTIRPYSYNFEQLNKIFLVKRDTVVLAIENNPVEGNLRIEYSNRASRNQFEYYNNTFIMKLGYSYSNVSNSYLLKYNHPVIGIIPGNEQETMKKCWNYPSYLKEIEHPYDYFCSNVLSTVIDNNLLLNIPIENKLYVINLDTYETKEIEIENSYLKTLPDKKIQNNFKRQFESDFYWQMIYNPFLEKLIMVQHVAAPYEKDDGFMVKDYKEDTKRILIFNKKLELESNFIFDNSQKTNLYFIQPTPKGFLDLKHLSTNGKMMFQEYIIKTNTL